MIVKNRLFGLLVARHDHGPDYPGSHVPRFEQVRRDCKYVAYALRLAGFCVVLDWRYSR